jgi:hypothetical protein
MQQNRQKSVHLGLDPATLSQQGFSEERRSLSPGLDVLDVRLDAGSTHGSTHGLDAASTPRHILDASPHDHTLP